MADNKKYYYLKLKDNFFDSEEMKVLESMQNGIMYSNLLLKLYLKSLKFNGALKFNDFIPYNEQMISAITNLNIDVVRSGLMVLDQLKLIERLDDGTIYMMNIQNYIGKSSTEAERKSVYRKSIKEKQDEIIKSKLLVQGQNEDKCPDSFETLTDECSREREIRDKRLENRDIDIKRDKIPQESEDVNTDINKISLSPFQIKSMKYIKFLEDSYSLPGRFASHIPQVTKWFEMYESEWVEEAIADALSKNKPISYAGGILKNWAREGKKNNKVGGKNGVTGEDLAAKLRDEGIGL